MLGDVTPLQTRIFVPFAALYLNDHWVETVVGCVVAPLVHKHGIERFWFSRYGEGANGSGGDTDLQKIPALFRHPQADFYRSVRFRLWLPATVDRTAFENELFDTVVKVSCAIADVRSYPDIDDLAWERFCGGDYTLSRRAERRDRMRDFLSSTARLFVHMLEGPNAQGEFRLEENKVRDTNPDSVTFQSIHHLFCNMTEVPLTVFVRNPVAGTHQYVTPDPDRTIPIRIRF